MLVRRLEMLPVECVARGYLTGSGWRDYIDTGEVCGHRAPAGPAPGATRCPSRSSPRPRRPREGTTSTSPARRRPRWWAAACWPRPSGSPWPSTRRAAERRRARRDHPGRHQVRAGRDPEGALVLGDEALTPDSSRLWPADRWAPGQSPALLRQAVPARLARRDRLGPRLARRRSCPPRSSRGPRRGTGRPTNASRRCAGDAGGGDRDAEGRRPRPPGPGRGRGARAARLRRRGRGAHRQAHRAGDRRRRPRPARPARCASSCSRTP